MLAIFNDAIDSTTEFTGKASRRMSRTFSDVADLLSENTGSVKEFATASAVGALAVTVATLDVTVAAALIVGKTIGGILWNPLTICIYGFLIYLAMFGTATAVQTPLFGGTMFMIGIIYIINNFC
jgi:hypothetical protein